MPRRKTQTRDVVRETLQNPPQVDAETAELLDGEAETIERIQAALDDSAGSHVWLIRVNEVFKTPEGWKEGWAFNADIGEIAALRERIAAECGPGRFRCRVLRDGLPFKQYDLEIRMTMAQRRAAANPAPAIPPAPVSVPGAAGGDLAGLMLQAINNQTRMLESILARPAAPAGPSIKETLETMQLMFASMPKAPEPAPPETGFKMFLQAFELSEKIHGQRGGEGETGSNIYDLVRDTLRQLPEILQTLKPQQGQPLAVAPPAALAPPRDRPAANPAPAPAAAPAAPGPRAQLHELQARVDKLKTYLLAQAAAGVDPAMCADAADELMPEELFQAIGEAPDPLAMLLQAWPEAAPHRAWFEKLIAEFFEEGEANGAAPGGPPADGIPANRPN